MTTFAYDTAGHLTTVTDPLSHQTTFTYNPAGQPVTVRYWATSWCTWGSIEMA